MKIMLATAVVLGGLVVSAAGSANAASAYQCQVQAQQIAEQQYPTGGGAIGGGVGGAIVGGLIAGATGGKVGTGVAVGAGAGLVVGSVAWQNAKQRAYDNAYAQCLGAQPVVVAPPPVYSAPPPTSGPFNGVIGGTSSVNVRNGPGVQYAVVGQMFANQSVSVASCNGGWCQIYLGGGGVGFVSQTYIYPIPG